jgi:hypothetical protein
MTSKEFIFLKELIMVKEINTQVLIKAPDEKVWSVLTDFDKYPEWNPFIRQVRGEVGVGKTITVRLEPPEAKGMTLKPKVLAFETNKEFRWLGHLLIPGLFDGEHIFELTDNADGTTTFNQREKFRGILIPLFKKMLDYNTKKGFRLMNTRLKEIAEMK